MPDNQPDNFFTPELQEWLFGADGAIASATLLNLPQLGCLSIVLNSVIAFRLGMATTEAAEQLASSLADPTYGAAPLVESIDEAVRTAGAGYHEAKPSASAPEASGTETPS